MSYSRSSFKSTSSSLKYSTDGDSKSRISSSYRSSNRPLLDPLSSSATSRRTTAITSDFGIGRHTSRAISADDDYSSVPSSVRHSTRLSSRLVSGDDDTGYTSRSTRQYSRTTSGDDYDITPRTARPSHRLSSTIDDDSYGISSSSRVTRMSSSSGVGDDEYGYSSSRSRKRLSSDHSSLRDDPDVRTMKRHTSVESSAGKDIDSSISLSYRSTRLEGGVGIGGGVADTTSYRSTKMSVTADSDDDLTFLRSTVASSATPKGEETYAAILDYTPPRGAKDEVTLIEGQQVVVLDRERIDTWKVRTKDMIEGYIPSCYLEKVRKKVVEEDSAEEEKEVGYVDPKIIETRKKRDKVIKELVETEEDFARDMQFVTNTYLRQLDSAVTPKPLKDSKEVLFSCFKEITEFHNNVLLEKLQDCVSNPDKIGSVFAQLESDFDNHVRYCRDITESLRLLDSAGPVRDHFNDYSRKIKDDKKLDEHLKLPLQRINDYQLLLKELIKYTTKLDENTDDLERAMVMVSSIPERATDLQQIRSSDSLYKAQLQGNKLAQMLKQVLRAKDWFDVTDSDGNTCERFVFLFKGRMFITDSKVNEDEQRSYDVKQIVKLRDVEFTTLNDNTIVINSKTGNQTGFPLKLRAKSVEQRDIWSNELSGIQNPKIEDDSSLLEIINKVEADDASLKKSKSEEMDFASTTPIVSSARQSTTADDISETRPSELDARAIELLEDVTANEELTTAITGTLRSGSMTSVEELPSMTEDDSVYFTASTTEPEVTATIAGKPTFVKTLKPLTENEGRTATLECELAGNGNASSTVKWLKDNKIITISDRIRTFNSGNMYYLIIQDITSDDSGLYSVAASNLQGSASSSAIVDIKPEISTPKFDSRPTSPGGSFLPHAPTFKVRLKDTELMESTTVRFELVVRGLPYPTVTFYKDDKELKQDNRVRVIYESKEVFELFIDHIRPEDAGVYKCVAVNSLGKDETHGKITISKDKLLFFGIEEVSEPAEQPQSGHRNSIGYPFSPTRMQSPTLFKWFKDGKEFEASERFQVQFDDQEDTIALIFQHVKPEDAGLYTCVASTSSGRISCSAELTVEGMMKKLMRDPIAPTIKLNIADVEVNEGASAMLEAKIEAYPKPKVKWFKGDKQIESGGRFKFLYEDEESYTLVIKGVSKADAGEYRVVAENDMGSAETSGNLMVTCSPKIRQKLKQLAVMTDGTLKLEIEVDANPAPNIKWFKDGSLLSEDQRIKFENLENVYDLIIEKVKLEDAGNYTALVTNEIGQQSAFSVVIVNAAPVFTKKLENIEVFESETVEFVAKVCGYPKPAVKFLKDGKPVQDVVPRAKLVKESEETYKLVINKASVSDVGTYSCIATNEYGAQKSDADLTVNLKKTKPNFSKTLQDCEGKVGDEMITFDVKVDGVPKPKIKWYHMDAEITEKDGFRFGYEEADCSYKLIIPKVTADKAGKYTCEAINSEGSASTSAKFTVNSGPSFVKKLENLTVEESAEAVLSVVVSGLPAPKVKWFKGDAEIKSNDKRYRLYSEESASFTLVIPSASREDIAEYRVIAENIYGKCTSVASVDVLGKQLKPSFTYLLTDTEALERETNIEFVVKVDSQPTSKPIIKWFLNGVEIDESDKRFKLAPNEELDTYKLIIKTATDDVAGKLKCTAANDYGISETNAKFTILTKPEFIKGLEDIDTTEGETVSMAVKIKGSPEPEVKFYKGDRDVSTQATIKIKHEVEEEYILEIEDISVKMSGSYKCHIFNKAGEAFSEALVTVRQKAKMLSDSDDQNKMEISDSENLEDKGLPVFVKHIKDQIVVTGDTVKFETQIDSRLPLTVKWLADGRELKPDKRTDIIQEEFVYKLIIKEIILGDSATICCSAKNANGEVMESALLTVKDKKIPKDALVEDSETISSIAETTDGQKPVDTAQVSDTDKKLPKFAKHISDTVVVSGDVISFEARIESVSPFAVRWLADNRELKPNRRTKIIADDDNHIYRLEIKDALVEDSAAISCVAENVAGKIVDNAILTVTDKRLPIFKKHITDTIVVTGNAIKFETQIDSIVPLTVKWLADNLPLKQDRRTKFINDSKSVYSLEIEDALVEDSATISCVAENAYGQVVDSALLTVNEPAVVDRRETGADVVVRQVDDGKTVPLQVNDKQKFDLPAVDKRGNDTEQADYGQSVPSELVDKKLVDKQKSVDQSIDGQLIPGQVVDKQGIGAQEVNGQAVPAKVVDRQISGDQLIDGQAIPAQLFDQKVVDKQKPSDQVVDSQSVPEKVVNKQKTGDQVIDGQLVTAQVVDKPQPVGKVDDGQVVPGKLIDKQGSDSQLDDVQLVPGKVVDKQKPSDQSVDGQSLPAKVIDKQKPSDQSVDGQSLPAKVIDKQKPSDQSVDGQSLPGKVVDKQKIGDQVIDSDVTPAQGVVDKKVVDKQKAGDQVVDGQVLDGRVVDKQVDDSAILTDKADKRLPVFTKHITDTVVVTKDVIRFEAQIDSLLPLTVKWLSDYKQLKPDKRTKLINDEKSIYKLEIKDALVDDSATVRCVAENSAGQVVDCAILTVTESPGTGLPVFTKHITDTLCITGDAVKFEAQIESKLPLTVKWLSHGKELKPDSRTKISDDGNNNFKLIIKDLLIEDSAPITCVARNEKGDAIDSARLTVQEPESPTIQGLSNVSAVEEREAKLEALITGLPKPTVTWYKDDEEVDAKFVVHEPDSNNYALIIKKLTSDLTGKYICNAVNVAGEAQECAQITISGMKPKFLRELEEAIVMSVEMEKGKLMMGQNAVFEAEIVGKPTPKITWYRNDIEVTPNDRITIANVDDEYKLEIKSVAREDVAKYTCKAFNRYGEATSICLLKFLDELIAPIFKKLLPPNIEIEEGEQLNLTARVDGDPMPHSKWSKDGVPITASDSVKIVSRPDGHIALIIDDAKLSDAGVYAVQVSNCEGSVSSSSQVSVCLPQRLPSFEELLPEKITLEEGKQLNLIAKVDGEPFPEIKWLKDGVVLKESENVVIATAPDGTAVLHIDHPVCADAGVYQIQAVNPKGQVSSSSQVEIVRAQMAPIVEKKLPASVKITEGEQLSLVAKVDGYPMPEIKWTKDGVPIEATPEYKIASKPDGTVSLSIPHAKLTDAGKYMLYAINILGQDTSTSAAQIAPLHKLSLITKELPDSVSVDEGKPLILVAKVGGEPLPQVQWLKDGVPIKPSPGIRVETKPDGTVSLSIDSAKPEDAGKYSIIAKTPEDEMESSADVDVQKAEHKPQIVGKLPDFISVDEGKPLNLIAKVSGVPLPQVQWSKDGVPIKPSKAVKLETKPDGTVTLSIDSAKPGDAGRYAITVETPTDKLVSSSAVDVQKAGHIVPDFVNKLPDILNVNEGKPLNLAAKVAADIPFLKVQWLKDGIPIDGSNNRVRTETKPDGTVSLSIDSARPDDAGVYELKIFYPDGTVTTASNVNVSSRPSTKPGFLKGLSSISATVGKPCTLECQITGEPSKITWYKNGEEIIPDGHYGFVRKPDGTIALLIDSVSVNDEGMYSVTITGADGESATSSAGIKVLEKGNLPKITSGLSPVNISEGSELCLTVKFQSDSPFTVKWLKDGKEIVANSHTNLVILDDGTAILIIDAANIGDAGKYEVVITNADGKVKSSARVEVEAKTEEKPKFLQGLQPTTLTAGCPGKLEVVTSGEPDVRFIKDGQQIIPNDRVHVFRKPNGRVELVFDDVRPEDEGEYIAIAANSSGETRSAAPVIVRRAPKFNQPLEETFGVEGFPSKLETKVDGEPKPQLEWTKGGQPLPLDTDHLKVYAGNDGTHALIIDNCLPDDTGIYGAIASNELGKAETSAPFTVKSAVDNRAKECAPLFVEPISDITVNEGQAICFACKIKANPAPQIRWYFNSQPIAMSDNVHLSFDGTQPRLTIAKCGASDKGVYEIEISNALGSAKSKAKAKVVEYSAPKFTKKLSDIETGISEPLKLVCSVTGFPQPNISWYYNGDVIEPGLRYSIYREGDECCLVIVKPSENDSGKYECRATNNSGTDSSKSNVVFIGKDGKGEAANFLKKLENYEVREGEVAKFTACVTGSPKPEIKWFKDGVEFDPTSSTKYNVEYLANGMIRFQIRKVDKTDIGEYRCHATNTYGYDNSIAQLSFESFDGKHKRKLIVDQPDMDSFKTNGVPVPLPDKPRITRMTDDDLTLCWHPSIPIQPRIPVTYVLEWCKFPDGVWMIYRTDIKDSQCDVRNLVFGQDYSFRVRVENKFGISDPSPVVTAFRSKLQSPPPPAHYKPKDYELLHKPIDLHASSPKFLRQEEDELYAIRGQPVTIEFWVYAHPDPSVVWFFNGEKIQMSGSKFDSLQDRNGQICLFLTRMAESDVGYYSCEASNEHGKASKKIKLLISDPPVFTKRFEETTVYTQQSARFECRVIGVPPPKVKWFKDWKPLHESSRVKILWEEPDRGTLLITGANIRDAGLYSCSASNIAGSASHSVMLHVEESEDGFDKYAIGYHKTVKPKTKPFEAFYDIGDELGRGTQGITYHSVERVTGKSYAAKMMHGKDKMREYMFNELDMMNQLGSHARLVGLNDAFAATPHSLTLVTDFCGGGELVESILHKGSLTESEVAHYVRQILQGIEYMHFKNIAHFGLTIGDVLIDRINGNSIKICDFGLAQRIIPGINYYVEFGHPEFVAPEIVDKQSATFVSDSWSAGIITYILFTGISPFLGANDRETLKNLQTGKINLSDDSLNEISSEGRDFLSKMLDYDPNKRMDVKSALQHPWLNLADFPSKGEQLSCIENLRDYHKKWKNWYVNASCKRYYRRRPLHSCFTHPSRMIYPPDERYTPSPSPERERTRTKFKQSQFDETMQQKINRDLIDPHSESQYQSGPDTYLLQLRDIDFPTRIRQYLRVGASRSPSLAASLRESHWGDRNIGYGFSPQVAVRERRRFTDVMDEEITDEKRGIDSRDRPMRLLREIGTPGYVRGQVQHIRQEASTILTGKSPQLKTMKPYFREKLRDITIKENDDIVFSCFAVAEPSPSYTWFRNDGILIESSRVEVKRTNEGRCELRLRPARAYDAGQYKCVARNEHGSVVCRARLKMGDIPGQPEPPEVKQGSNTEVYLAWSPPKHDGNANIVCYKLQYQRSDDESSEWITVADNILHEFFVVKNLEPETKYYFRLSAKNKFGWSDPSFLSECAKTQTNQEAVRIKLPKAMIYRQTVTEQSGEVDNEDTLPVHDIDYGKELNPISLTKADHSDLYSFVAEVSRGRFSLISKTLIKETNQLIVSKAVLTQSEIESGVNNEFEIMKSLAHERIVDLRYASYGSTLYVLAMEKLSGIDVLTYLAQRHKYTEETVAKIIQQVLDAIEYLHFRGICLLELQPDNVVMVNQRRHDIKLCDFANARHVPIAGAKVSINGCPEYIAPELIKNEEVDKSADIWCVGVLAYILLSGVSPFRGATDSETAVNVTYVRYLFDNIYPEVTQEAIRFVMTLFKLTPHKRPTIDECLENKWLLPNDFMIKRRESAVFSSHKLSEFSDYYHSMKSRSMPSLLANTAGISLTRSDSVVMDAYAEI